MVNTLGDAVVSPFTNIWHELVEYVPSLIGAVIIALVGYFIGLLIGNIVKHILQKANLDKWIVKKDLSKTLLNIKLSVLIGHLVKWSIFVSFLAPAASIIKLDILADLLKAFALWFPSLILAIIIMAIGLILSKLVAKQIHVSKDNKVSRIVATTIQVIIIVIFLDISLNQIGIKILFLESIVLMVIGAFLLAAAIAFGIGIGNSVKKHSEELVHKYIVIPKKKK